MQNTSYSITPYSVGLLGSPLAYPALKHGNGWRISETSDPEEASHVNQAFLVEEYGFILSNPKGPEGPHTGYVGFLHEEMYLWMRVDIFYLGRRPRIHKDDRDSTLKAALDLTVHL